MITGIVPTQLSEDRIMIFRLAPLSRTTASDATEPESSDAGATVRHHNAPIVYSIGLYPR
jgi:hypothetical protein